MAELFRGATQGEALLTDTMFIQRQKLLDKLEPHRVKDERLEGIIASINFPILQQVFDEERRQAVHATQDGEVAPARFFTPNDIVLTNKEGYKAIGRTTTDQLMSYAGGPEHRESCTRGGIYTLATSTAPIPTRTHSRSRARNLFPLSSDDREGNISVPGGRTPNRYVPFQRESTTGPYVRTS